MWYITMTVAGSPCYQATVSGYGTAILGNSNVKTSGNPTWVFRDSQKLLLSCFFIFLSVYSYAQKDWVDIIPQTISPLFVKVEGFNFGADYDFVADIEGSVDNLLLYTGYEKEIIKNWNLYGEVVYSGLFGGLFGSFDSGQSLWGKIGTDYNIPIGKMNLSLGLNVPIIILSNLYLFGDTIDPFDLTALNVILSMVPKRDETGFGCKIEYTRMIEPSDLFENISFTVFYQSDLLGDNNSFGITAKLLLSNGIYADGFKIIPEFTMGNDIASIYIQLPLRSRTAPSGSNGERVFDLPLLSFSMGLRITPKWSKDE